MLNDRQVAELCARLAITPAGRTLLATIRTTPPSRRAQGGSGNVVVRVASRKMGCVIQAESHKNEGAAVLAWEHDSAVYEFYDQPTALKHVHHGPSGLATTHLKRLAARGISLLDPTAREVYFVERRRLVRDQKMR